MILAGDIGGTKADLGLFDRGAPRRPRKDARLPTRGHPSLESVVRNFLDATAARPERAVFGIAGPVRANRCEATNLPWHVDGDALGKALGFPVVLLNDLAATAWGLEALGEEDFVVLQAGRPAPDGARALIAAGTGLGESIVTPKENGGAPLASEGGHSDFGPRNDVEDALNHWLRARYGRVSYERILSGPGIADVYRFMSDSGRGAESPDAAQRFAAADDPAAAVTAMALDGSCQRARLAIQLFVDVYGAEAGNLALKGLATAGVFLAGGIAPRIGPFFTDGRCARAFVDKGRLSPVLSDIPLKMVLDPRTALWGAASLGLRSTKEDR